MKISVFRIDWYTVTEDEKGKEIRRTSPQQSKVAGVDLPTAMLALPSQAKGTHIVLIQSHVLQHDITFGGKVEPEPGAKKF
jgi:hypothetical protein